MRQRILLLMVLTVFLAVLPAVLGQEQATQDDGLVGAFLLENAQRLAEAGDVERALNNYTLFIALNPNHADGYARRAATYIADGQVKRALRDMDRAVELAADDDRYAARVLALRAEMHTIDHNVDAAIADYDRAIERDPAYTLAYRNRGLIYDLLGQDDQALADYSVVLEAEPDDVDLYVRRANIYAGQQDLTSALDDLTQAIDLDPDNSELYILRGSLNKQALAETDAAQDYLTWLQQINIRQIDESALNAGDDRRLDMQGGWMYRIPFEGRAGDRLFLVVNSRSVDALAVILGPDGTPLFADDDGGSGLNVYVHDFALPEDGTYTVVIGHARGGSQGVISVLFELIVSNVF